MKVYIGGINKNMYMDKKFQNNIYETSERKWMSLVDILSNNYNIKKINS